MKQYLKLDPWKIIEEDFDPDNNPVSESVFSLGNGYMGQRANFEEKYSGESLQGSYMAGVYYPDKTVVGWWKNGYPEYFAKVLNSTNWIGIDVEVNNQVLDLAKCKVDNFQRVLNMKEGFLERSFTATFENGNQVEVKTKRFLSMVRGEIGAIKYSLKPLNFSGEIKLTPYLDGDVVNQDSNYGEQFWDGVSSDVDDYQGYVKLKTKKLDFHICTYMRCNFILDGKEILANRFRAPGNMVKKEKYVASKCSIDVSQGEELTLYKYIANTSSLYYDSDKLVEMTRSLSLEAQQLGFEKLLEEHSRAWDLKWQESDIKIEGDIAAQQGIRFNIFQLNQTYTGEDARLNIGPKGFTGEKYGGSTYWDTE
ncbi:MAG: glycoside hydrolase family 65 protein, partial [Halanaerobiales bacterium]